MTDVNECVCCGKVVPEGSMVCQKCLYKNNKTREVHSLSSKHVCNRCGRELDFFDLQQEFIIHKKVQYGSSYDGCEVNYQLCCDCFDKAVEDCKVNPIKEV